MSDFLPNTFQTPNQYVDEFMAYLTGEELKVLIYATRRIIGFQKRQDNISLSQFTRGTKNKDGETLDSGTGLSLATVKKCLANLVDFGLMIRVERNDVKKNHGDLWSLQWEKKKVNKAAMIERGTKKSDKQKTKMSKARSMRQTPANGIEDPSPNGIEQTPANGIETQKPVETQGNPVLKEGASATPEPPKPIKASDIPELVLFREVVRHYPKQFQREPIITAIQTIKTRLNRDVTTDDLQPFWTAWAKVSGNEWSLVWLLEWAVSGVIPGKPGAKPQTATPAPVQDTPEQLEELRRKARDMFFPPQQVTA